MRGQEASSPLTGQTTVFLANHMSLRPMWLDYFTGETIDRHTHIECLLLLYPRKAALENCALRTWNMEFGVTGGGLLPLQLLPGLKNWQFWHVESFPWWDVTKFGRIMPLASVPGMYCLHGGALGTHVCTHKSTGKLP